MRNIEPEIIEATSTEAASTAPDLSHWIWLAPIVGVAAYPLLVKAIFFCASSTGIAGFIGAAVSVLLALAIPGIALWSLLTLRNSTDAGIHRLRLVLHFAFSAPPLYILLGFPAAILVLAVTGAAKGLSEQQFFEVLLTSRDALWWSSWAIVALLFAFGSRLFRRRSAESAGIEKRKGRTAATPRLRSIHRSAVLLVVLAFLFLHLGNHLLALWSSEAQAAAMITLRQWYRAPVIEALILLVFTVGAIAGMMLTIRATRAPGNVYRMIQTSSGFYLALFLVNHLLAVFRHRGVGGNTNWAFATGGEPGVLGTEPYVAVFLYYVLAVLLVVVHLGAGLRAVSLARGKSRRFADRSFAVACVSGMLMAAMTAAALLGIRIVDVFS